MPIGSAHRRGRWPSRRRPVGTDPAPVLRLERSAGRARRQVSAVHRGERPRSVATARTGQRQALNSMFHVKHCVPGSAPPTAGLWLLTVIRGLHPSHRRPSSGQVTDPSMCPRLTPVSGAGCATARLMRGRSRSRAAGARPRSNRSARSARWSNGNCYPQPRPPHPGNRTRVGSRRSASQIRKASRGRTTRGRIYSGAHQRSLSAAERVRPVTRGGRRLGGWVPRRCCRFGRRRGRR